MDNPDGPVYKILMKNLIGELEQARFVYFFTHDARRC
jgi:hypothetical protein